MTRHAPSLPGGALPPGLEQRYQKLVPIAEGGMGAVYRAFDARLGRVVALKVIRQARVDRAGMRRRFKREGAYLAAVRHPNIVRLYDYDEIEGVAYLTMEFVNGFSLAELLVTGALAARETARVGAMLADALATVHRHGILHRDVKPHNVLLAPDGTPKLTDFGLAKASGLDAPTALTESGQLIGTIGYVAPEVMCGEEPTVRSDSYSLGVLLYECLTGDLPRTKQVLLDHLANKPAAAPPPPSGRALGGDATLDALVMRAIELEPERRFESCAELRESLEAWLGHKVVSSEASRPPPETLAGTEAAAGTAAVSAVARAAHAFPVVPDDAPDRDDARPGRGGQRARRSRSLVLRDRSRALLRRSRRSRLFTAALVLSAVAAAAFLAVTRQGPRAPGAPAAASGPPPAVALSPAVDRLEARFVTAADRRFAWRVAPVRGSAAAVEGAEPRPGREHRLEAVGLSPLTSYVLRLYEGDRVYDRPFATTTPLVGRGAYAAAHEGRLALQATLAAPQPGLEVAVRETSRTDVRRTRLPPVPGPWVVPCPDVQNPRAWEWELTLNGVTLAAGTAAANLELAPPPVPTLKMDGYVKHTVPVAGPCWVADRFLVADAAGVLTCWEPFRSRRDLGQAAPDDDRAPPGGVTRAFVFQPPGQPEEGRARALGGLLALDDRRVLVAALLHVRRRVALWVLDVPTRERVWRERAGSPAGAPTGPLPPFATAPADPWNSPLGPLESVDTVTFDQPSPPLEDGLLCEGVAVVLLGHKTPRWLCWDVAGRRTLWLRSAPDRVPEDPALPRIDLKAPLLDYRFEGRFTFGAAWGTASPPVLAGDRVYTRLGYTISDRRHQAVLASFPLRRPSDDATDVWLVRHAAVPGSQNVPVDPQNSEVLLTALDRVLRFEAGAREPTEVTSVPGLTLGFRAGPAPAASTTATTAPATVVRPFLEYLSGPVLRRGSVRYLTSLELRAPGAPHAALPIWATSVRLLTWPDGAAAPTVHGPALSTEPTSPNQAHCVRDARPWRELLVGSTTLTLFAVDLSTGRSGSWAPAYEPARRWSINADGLVALAAARGGVGAVPARLLVNLGAPPLPPPLPTPDGVCYDAAGGRGLVRRGEGGQ